MNLEYGSGIATWFWVGVSLECSWTMGQGYSNLKVLLELQDLLPEWLTHRFGEFDLVVGRRFQFLPAGKSPEGYLSMPMPWQLLPHESSPWERKWEAALFLWLTFGRHTASFLSDLIDYTDQPYLMLEGATPGCESQEERLSGANLETGGHNSQH